MIKLKIIIKKISNNNNSNTSENNTDIKIKEKKPELNSNNNMNNYISSKNVFTYKKKVNQNIESAMQCNTERKKTENTNNANTNKNNENVKNFINNNFNRNTVFMPRPEFNLTWSRLIKKDMESSFENNITQKSPPQSVIMSAKNVKKLENRNNKYMTKVSSKNKYSVDKFDNYNLKRKPDITPQKITINRKIITNKLKNNKNCFSSNNVSIKNINNIQPKDKRIGFDENKNISQNIINTSASNKMMSISNNYMNEGEIYSHKKKNSLIGIESKNNNDSTNENIVKKNSIMNNKYNVTINNINNCNYINLIQGDNKPEIKIIKKRINKNN